MPQEISPEEKKTRDGLRSPIIEAMEGEGITVKSLAKHLKKELKAKQIKHFLAPQGEVIYTDPFDALEIQQRARQDAHKLRGDYPSDRLEVDEQITVNIVNYADLSKISQGGDIKD